MQLELSIKTYKNITYYFLQQLNEFLSFEINKVVGSLGYLNSNGTVQYNVLNGCQFSQNNPNSATNGQNCQNQVISPSTNAQPGKYKFEIRIILSNRIHYS